jgi:hypothetical protein
MEGIILSEFVPQGQTVNSAFYEEVLQHLRESFWLKRPEKWRNIWMVHHNNLPCHT